jgi:hypothetical protein
VVELGACLCNYRPTVSTAALEELEKEVFTDIPQGTLSLFDKKTNCQPMTPQFFTQNQGENAQHLPTSTAPAVDPAIIERSALA